MKTKIQTWSVRTALLAVMSVVGQALLLLAPYTSNAQQPYEGYYNYLGNYPNEANPGWHQEAQGLAHDQNNWFITQRGSLWKIPVTRDLNDVNLDDQGVKVKKLCSLRQPGTNQCLHTDMPDLVSEGYNHLGDLEQFEFEGQGYLFIPVEGGPHPAIAVFRAENLEYCDHAYVRLYGESQYQVSAPWCALDPQGILYTSSFKQAPSRINRYAVDWEKLRTSGTLILNPLPSITILDESGNVLRLNGPQGGVISPSGELLYLVADDGIHVFDLSTRKRIQRSRNGSGHFNYEFNPDFPYREEPEGITIWDLDNGRAPGIRGQLHVLLLDNDWPDVDDVYMKHYTHTICVDRNYIGEGLGTPSKPFNTVREANNIAWDGAQIKIRSGSYSEALTISKRIRVLTESGTVTIGK